MPHSSPELHFAREPLTPSLWDEALPLLVPHWQEIAGHLTGAALAPNRERYGLMADMGILAVFTARNQRHLVGYASFTCTTSLHCASIREAQQDALYLDPVYRGTHGAAFLAFCSDALFDDGAKVVYQFTPGARDFGAVLKRQGFEALGTLYAKAAPAPVSA